MHVNSMTAFTKHCKEYMNRDRLILNSSGKPNRFLYTTVISSDLIFRFEKTQQYCILKHSERCKAKADNSKPYATLATTLLQFYSLSTS